MIGLQMTRAVVVDNEPDDGLALIAALAHRGVAASYFSGRVEELPEQPLQGVRLAALDLDLTGGYTSGGDPKQTVSPLIGVLNKIVSPQNGPYIALLWTSHTELSSAFEEMATERLPKSAPHFLVILDKSSARDEKGGGFNLRFIAEEVQRRLAESSPMDSILLWEQTDYDGMAGTTSAISELAAGDRAEQLRPDGGVSPADRRNKWKEAAMGILTALSKASAGERDVSQAETLKALYEALNQIHFDRIQKLADEISDQQKRRTLPFLDPKAKIRREIAGEINRMLLTAEVGAADTEVRPGNVYRVENPPIQAFQVGEVTLEILREVFQHPDDEPKPANVVPECVPIAVEISPMCDYAQANMKLARLLGGVLLPAKYAPQLKKRTLFARSEGPVFLAGEEIAPADYYIVLDAHYLTGVALADMTTRRPLFRLRQELFVDILSWFSSHAARPGRVSVEPA